jgi:DNA end-binding protein Ku
MEVAQFVDASQLDPEYFEKPYFVVPENDSQTEAFLTVRKAMQETGKLAITKIAFGGREHLIALGPAGSTDGKTNSARGKKDSAGGKTDSDDHGGMMAYTLRYPAELRKPEEYFRDIKSATIDKESLGLARELIKRKTAPFHPEKFVDGYEVALHELVEAKLKHLPIPKDVAPAPARSKVVNLMDALRKSMNTDTAPASAAKSKSPGKKPPQRHGLSLVAAAKSGAHAKSASRSSSKRKSA